MVKELHGKCYYVELRNWEERYIVYDFTQSEEALKNEEFYLTRHPDGRWIICSDSPVESFRGDKYKAWERVKRKLYASRKTSS